MRLLRKQGTRPSDSEAIIVPPIPLIPLLQITVWLADHYCEDGKSCPTMQQGEQKQSSYPVKGTGGFTQSPLPSHTLKQKGQCQHRPSKATIVHSNLPEGVAFHQPTLSSGNSLFLHHLSTWASMFPFEDNTSANLMVNTSPSLACTSSTSCQMN